MPAFGAFFRLIKNIRIAVFCITPIKRSLALNCSRMDLLNLNNTLHPDLYSNHPLSLLLKYKPSEDGLYFNFIGNYY